MNRSGAAAAHVLAGVSACAVAVQAVLCQAAGDPMAFWETVSWSASNNIAQAVSFEGRPGRELLEVVKIGNANGDSYQDILVRVSQTNYALILGGNRPKKMFTSAMDIDSPGIVQCWFATSDTSGGPYLMRAAALGDIDKDGFDDFFMVGSNSPQGGGNSYKWKYIIFGRRNWPSGTYDLNIPSSATPKEHLELHNFVGGQLDSNITRGGDYAAALGDIDNDGVADMALALPAASYYMHGVWHDNSFQIRFYRGNTNRTAILCYARDQLDIPWGAFDKIWQGCTGGYYNRILMSDLDGDGRKELLLLSQGNFPIWVWKPSNFRNLGPTPGQDTPKDPSEWPGGFLVTEGVHAGETNDLLTADCCLDIAGFGPDLLVTCGDVDGDGKENVIFSSWQYSGWSAGNVVIVTNFSGAALSGGATNWITLGAGTNWIHRWTKLEGDGWYWGGHGLAYLGDLNRDGIGDVLVDDRLGDFGHNNGYTAGGIRFIGGSSSGWSTTTRLQLPLIFWGEHDDNGYTKLGDGLAYPIVDISGFGKEQEPGFAVMAPYWDPDGTTNAYGKLYLVCPFAQAKGTFIVVR